MNTLKEYVEEVQILPTPIKVFIIAAFAILVLTVSFNVAVNLQANRKIEKLELQNKQLETEAIKASTRASLAEENAANEALRSTNLESQLKTIDRTAEVQNKEITQNNEKTITIRRRLDNVRRAPAPRASETDLERRLEKRYGQPELDK